MKKVRNILLLGAITTLGLIAQPATPLPQEVRGTAHLVFQQYVSGNDAHSALDHLIETQQALKANESDPELQNLLKYIDVCIRKIRKDVQTPFSEKNAAALSDAVDAIDEATRYITDHRPSSVLMASR